MESDWKAIESNLLGEISSFYRYHRSVSGGMQEYIKAYCFWYFLKEGRLCSKHHLEQKFHDSELIPIRITLEDYVGGIFDMTRELMRRAISSLSSSRLGKDLEIYRFLRRLEEGLYRMFHYLTSLEQKWIMLEENVRKVENACYLWKLREFDALFISKNEL